MVMATDTENSPAIAGDDESPYRRWRRPPVLTRRNASAQSGKDAEKTSSSSQAAKDLLLSQKEEGPEILRLRQQRIKYIIEEAQKRRDRMA